MNHLPSMSTFQKWATATLLATLLLIFIGGFVRVSGSGLGCPDWPHCWGSWWPPASIEDIDGEKYPLEEFNHTKMWIEYANRLVGVAVGLLVLGTFCFSLRYWKADRWMVAGAGAAVLLVAFEGWLGGKVVESELAGGMVTIHLAGAVVLFGLLIWIAWRSAGERRVFEAGSDRLRRQVVAFGWVAWACSSVQMLLGARVREELDLVAKSGVEAERSDWLEMVGGVFLVHRSFAWVLCVLAVWALLWLRRSGVSGRGRWLVASVPAVVLLQMLTGVALAYLAIPAWAQVTHLGLSALLCCLAFGVVLGFQKPVGGGER